jgi:hypothetical protein
MSLYYPLHCAITGRIYADYKQNHFGKISRPPSVHLSTYDSLFPAPSLTSFDGLEGILTLHMPSGRFNHGRNKPESGIGVVVAPVVVKLDSSDANNTPHSVAITTTSTIVNIAPTLTPFFANCLSSSLSTKNIAIPPTNPKNMGNRYHIFEPRFTCCSDNFFYLTFFHARYKLVINNLFVNLSNSAILWRVIIIIHQQI